MATDIFRLLGTISIDMTDFNAKMSNAMQQVNNLATAINNLNGTTANVNINQTGAPATVNNAAATPTTTTTTADQTNDDDDDDGGGGSWTIGRGVAANLASRAAEIVLSEGWDLMVGGWKRNQSEELTAKQFEAITGLGEKGSSELVEGINQFAYDTPLNVEDAWGVATRLLNYGIDPNELVDTMWWMGDITMGDSARMMSFAKGYTEALGKDGLYAQEANQMINAGVPVYAVLEDYYASDEYTGENKGLTATEIKGRLNANSDPVTVPDEDLTAAFKMSTAEGGKYHNMMTNMMETSWGQEQVLGENLTNLASGIVKPFQDIWSTVILPKLNDAAGRTVNLMEEFSHLGDPSPDPLARQFWKALKTDPGIAEAVAPYETGFRFVNNAQRVISSAHGKPFIDSALGFAYEHLGGKEIAAMSRYMFHGFDSSDGFWDYLLNDDAILPVESLRKRRRKKTTQDDQYGAPPDVQTLYFDDGQHLLPATSGYSSLMVQLQNMPQQITAAVQEGMNGVTITATVTTGDVRLQDGALVGALTPKINMVLGAMNASSNRG